MYEAVTILVVGLTAVAFWRRNALLLIAATVGWVCFGVLMSHVGTGAGEPFEGNTALPQAFLALGGIMAIVCIISAVQIYTSARKRPSTLEDDFEDYKKKVLDATRKRR